MQVRGKFLVAELLPGVADALNYTNSLDECEGRLQRRLQSRKTSEPAGRLCVREVFQWGIRCGLVG